MARFASGLELEPTDSFLTEPNHVKDSSANLDWVATALVENYDRARD
jgi:hypothetical protein